MMRKIILALLLAAALGFLPGTVYAQNVGPPYFPQTLPSNTLVGRIQAGTGPASAIPITTLQQLAIGNISVGVTPVLGGTSNELLAVTGSVLSQVTAGANCLYLTNVSDVPSCATTLANTFTLNPPSNANALAISGYSLSGANAQAMLNYSGTLNTSGSPNVLDYSIVDTAHGGSTKFMNLLGGSAGTTSLFSVDMSGNLTIAGTCTGCGGGITANSTMTSGFTAGQVPYSDGSKIQASNINATKIDFGNTIANQWSLTGVGLNLIDGSGSTFAAFSSYDTSAQNNRDWLIANVASGLRWYAGYLVQWSSNTSGDAFGNIDTGLARNGAGIVEVDSGTAGTFRDILARGLISHGTTFASLPATTAGTVAYITDGLAANCGDTSCTTWGTNVTGGTGALKLLVWYNGSHWTLIGK